MTSPQSPPTQCDIYVWIDLETTGIDPVNDHIMEISTIVTDYNLNILSEYDTRILHLKEDILLNMDPWCIEQHGKSGLSKYVLESRHYLKETEDELFEFISRIVPEQVGIIAGNSVHFDKEFLRHHMPKVFNWLSYKILDVSTIKTCMRNWKPEVPKFRKTYTHRALNDIRESIQELEYYKKNVFHCF